MNLWVERLDLLFDGTLPSDSLNWEKHRQIFCEAKPLIDRAFKVDRPGFVRVWWFDRYVEHVISLPPFVRRFRFGKFYSIDWLRSETDRQVAHYLTELGYQVKLTVISLDRLEYAALAVFDGRGAILKENEEYRLRSLEAEELVPVLVSAGRHPEADEGPAF